MLIRSYPYCLHLLVGHVHCCVKRLLSLKNLLIGPLRTAPRLVPLISAIGASIFLQNASQLLFGPKRRDYINPESWPGGFGMGQFDVGRKRCVVHLYRNAVDTAFRRLTLGLFYLVQKTKLGQAMRAVAQDKKDSCTDGH